ncbi:hypothetical protein [Leifsonia sp. Leaf264]|uniref:hypothetical protein n=1 Tax=Leifsonia sp. Leaf264 TaxID=1736314 RepID=UPI0007023B78|nr:hypothetical protein [Leifsonia sp. Leaf264]KQO98846.1 hypothetical protein ASF30_12350 [Leifsonia sp. Leaf264]
MSKYEWEEGTITLPSSGFAQLRKAVEEADRAHKEVVFEHTQKFWAGLTAKQKSDRGEYNKAFDDYCDKHARTKKVISAPSRWSSGVSIDVDLSDDIEAVVKYGRAFKDKPTRVLKSDMNFPTNRTTEFSASPHGGCITFNKDRGTVTWSVGENNHAVSSARGGAVAEAFFKSLRDVKWRKNTGGVISGNDEYNREGRDYGNGGNYVTVGFGPIGAIEAPWQTDEFVMTDGKRYSRGDYDKLARSAAAASRRNLNQALKSQGQSPARTQRGKTSAASTAGSFTNRNFGGYEGAPLHF